MCATEFDSHLLDSPLHPPATVQNGDGGYGSGQQCTTTGSVDATVVHDNSIYTPTATVTECGMSLAAWQAAAPGVNDPGTVALVTPNDATLLALAKTALGMP